MPTAGLVRGELVGEGLARLDRRLRVRVDAVHRVRDPDAVEVDDVRLGQLVVQHDPHLVADLDVDLRRRHDAVVRPRLDDLAGLDLPVDDRRGAFYVIYWFSCVLLIVDWEVEPGKVVQAWTYNGIVPAPEIHVEVGDKVRVVLHNELPSRHGASTGTGSGSRTRWTACRPSPSRP